LFITACALDKLEKLLLYYKVELSTFWRAPKSKQSRGGRSHIFRFRLRSCPKFLNPDPVRVRRFFNLRNRLLFRLRLQPRQPKIFCVNMFLRKKLPRRLLLLQKLKIDSRSGSDRNTQNRAGVEFVTPDHMRPLKYRWADCHILWSKSRPEVTRDIFWESDSAPVPKVLNPGADPGPANFQIWELDFCSNSGYNHRFNRNSHMFNRGSYHTDSATAEIEKWDWIRFRFLTNFWLRVRIRVRKKNAESLRSRLRLSGSGANSDPELIFLNQSRSNHSPKTFFNVQSKTKLSPRYLKNEAFSQKKPHFFSINWVQIRSGS